MGASRVKPFSDAECKAMKRFMRSYRKNHADLDEDEVKRSGENAWGKLMPHQKKHFEVRPKEISVNRVLPATRKKPDKQKKSVPGWRYHVRKRTMFRPKNNLSSPVMSGAFIGFLREYHRRNASLDVKKRLQRAAKMWSKLTEAQKSKFRMMFNCHIAPLDQQLTLHGRTVATVWGTCQAKVPPQESSLGKQNKNSMQHKEQPLEGNCGRQRGEQVAEWVAKSVAGGAACF
ncbi:uncharacterized protein Dere_GG14537 [Drosophila erecta]|uniref:HMG box domain-containing protein n=1 Tax=Drosophila erecta TaxID=7220 RepID=B3NBE1_DROER|nr:uncharacterized protein Dere_GG14537 [Drosophila erecta]